jgi:hypothetical protein
MALASYPLWVGQPSMTDSIGTSTGKPLHLVTGGILHCRRQALKRKLHTYEGPAALLYTRATHPPTFLFDTPHEAHWSVYL